MDQTLDRSIGPSADQLIRHRQATDTNERLTQTNHTERGEGASPTCPCNPPSIGRPIDQTADRLIKWSIDPSIHQSIHRSNGRSIHRSIGRSIEQTDDRLIRHHRPIHRSNYRSIHRSIGRSIDQTVDRSIDHFFLFVRDMVIDYHFLLKMMTTMIDHRRHVHDFCLLMDAGTSSTCSTVCGRTSP